MFVVSSGVSSVNASPIDSDVDDEQNETSALLREYNKPRNLKEGMDTMYAGQHNQKYNGNSITQLSKFPVPRVVLSTISFISLGTSTALLGVYGPSGPIHLVHQSSQLPAWIPLLIMLTPSGFAVICTLVDLLRQFCGCDGNSFRKPKVFADIVMLAAASISIVTCVLRHTDQLILPGAILVTFFVNGLALVLCVMVTLGQSQSSMLWGTVLNLGETTIPAAMWCTLSYTEFGFTIESKFKHIPMTQSTATIGVDPHSDLCLKDLRPLDYGRREVDVRTKGRLDYDRAAAVRRHHIAHNHFSVVRDTLTDNVYLKICPSVKSVTYIGLEEQNRFEPGSLRWQGAQSIVDGPPPHLMDDSSTDYYKQMVNDTTLRRVSNSDVLSGRPIQIFDRYRFEKLVQQTALSGRDTRAELYRYTNILVVVGDAVPNQLDSDGAVAVRIVLHSVRDILSAAPPPTRVTSSFPTSTHAVATATTTIATAASITPLPLGMIERVDTVVGGLRSHQLATSFNTTDEVVVVNKQLEAEIKTLQTKLKLEVENTSDAVAVCEALQEKYDKVVTRAQTKVKTLRAEKQQLACEVANLKQDLLSWSPVRKERASSDAQHTTIRFEDPIPKTRKRAESDVPTTNVHRSTDDPSKIQPQAVPMILEQGRPRSSSASSLSDKAPAVAPKPKSKGARRSPTTSTPRTPPRTSSTTPSTSSTSSTLSTAPLPTEADDTRPRSASTSSLQTHPSSSPAYSGGANLRLHIHPTAKKLDQERKNRPPGSPSLHHREMILKTEIARTRTPLLARKFAKPSTNT
eukprot:m.151894 g.151894  ORF g.151894 m.151894 type:complete len:799 (-) comp30785_c1_seq2:64-2460(-)